MEVASLGLAIGAVGGIFTSCVDCFQYLQLGRHFGEDYGFCVAQLEAARIRLLRWGEPMGFLDENFDPDELSKKDQWRPEDIEKAKQWLSMILHQFEKAEASAKEYEQFFAATKDDVTIPTLDVELSKAGESKRRLIDWTKALAKKRQRYLSLGKKAQWALYDKKEFETMISKVSLLITNLVGLFPMLMPHHQELCKEEVQTLPKESMRDLLEVISGADKPLSQAVANEAQSNRMYFADLKYDGAGFAHLGNVHEYGSEMAAQGMTVTGLHIGGTGGFQAGHIFKGRNF